LRPIESQLETLPVSKPEDMPNGPNIWPCFVASIVATAASLIAMGAILACVLWLDGSASSTANIILTPLMALVFGWFIFPLSSLVAFGLFGVVGHRLSSAETLPRRRSWVLSGAGVGLLVALAMSGEIWLHRPGWPDYWSPMLLLAALAGPAALSGIVGLTIWKELVVWQRS
jgi:hypothetical protein